jgi:hypothetical protein
LRLAGASIESAPTTQTRMTGVLVHLLRQNCRVSPFGFSINGTVLTLDTHDGCGVLRGSAAVTAIEGVDLSAITQQAYLGFQAKCRVGGPLKLTVLGGQNLDVPCPQPLADAEAANIVTRWRPQATSP